MKKIRTTIYIDPALYAGVKLYSYKRGISNTEIISVAIQQYLKKKGIKWEEIK